jgi:hypothetical protein
VVLTIKGFGFDAHFNWRIVRSGEPDPLLRTMR